MKIWLDRRGYENFPIWTQYLYTKEYKGIDCFLYAPNITSPGFFKVYKEEDAVGLDIYDCFISSRDLGDTVKSPFFYRDFQNGSNDILNSYIDLDVHKEDEGFIDFFTKYPSDRIYIVEIPDGAEYKVISAGGDGNFEYLAYGNNINVI